ncbi:hypothetical protein GOC76_29985 [Sinorhizobium medicae]|nr:hypothetical protein [Sinorhizobium medicae]QND35792.1 hypothetical protein HB772_29080 [Sinorhizobium meliloti]
MEMKTRSAALLVLLVAFPAAAGDETQAIQDEMVAKGASKDIAFKLGNAYGVYSMAEFCQRTGSTSQEDMAKVADVAKRYEAMINLPNLQEKLWEASSKEIKALSIMALDTNQSYGMCLDVRDSVDKVLLELKETDPKPF